METKEDILILAIESSCDETAASVVKNGRGVLSNIISSQIELHTLYGGVVPEIASRKHIEKINQVIEEALVGAGVTLEEITAIAVTYGPGLVGALSASRRQKRSVLPRRNRWSACITLRDISALIISRIRNLSLRLFAWSCLADTHILLSSKIMGNTIS